MPRHRGFEGSERFPLGDDYRGGQRGSGRREEAATGTRESGGTQGGVRSGHDSNVLRRARRHAYNSEPLTIGIGFSRTLGHID